MLPQQSSLLGLYGPVLLHLLGNMGNIAPAAGPIRRINSSNIALPGRIILSVLWLKSGYTVKYSLSHWEIPWAPPSGSGYISLYIPPLVIIQIQSWESSLVLVGLLTAQCLNKLLLWSLCCDRGTRAGLLKIAFLLEEKESLDKLALESFRMDFLCSPFKQCRETPPLLPHHKKGLMNWQFLQKLVRKSP